MTAVLDAGVTGRTTISDAVVRRLATAALREVEGVRDNDQVSAQVLGHRVVLSTRFAVAYPQSVGAVTERVRQHLMDRVGAMTGLAVQRVDVRVARLVADGEQTRRVR
ncbi:Asp23/Gls24 family envelope stress response protein [Pseudonocardiaceae bacterium YIM PH 21723]|nr:Asp23/Gls24 family envelope stress response protein [Pseudonocardiaceae bacterium YIM PH 21723]